MLVQSFRKGIKEMVKKIFLNAKNIAEFLCPECEKSWIRDVTKFRNLKKRVSFKCKCPCGHTFAAVLERRRFPRKTTNLSGAFIHDRKRIRGMIFIRNISMGGIGFELSNDYILSSGDVVLVRFNLDDPFGTMVSREVLIKIIEKRNICAEFLERIWKHDLLYLYLNQNLNV